MDSCAGYPTSAETRAAYPLQGARWRWLLVLLADVVVLALARTLSPVAAGMGTHTQLGLPPCPLLRIAGMVCPSCGATTAFAHMADGEFGRALAVHPVAALACLLCVALVPTALFCVIRPRSRWVRAIEDRSTLILQVLTLSLLAQWMRRVCGT